MAGMPVRAGVKDGAVQWAVRFVPGRASLQR